MKRKIFSAAAKIIACSLVICSLLVMSAGSAAAFQIGDYNSGQGSSGSSGSDLIKGAYEYTLEDGMVKYWLDLSGDDLTLHCFFRSGDPEFSEEIYTLPLENASVTKDNLILEVVKNESGIDISSQFALVGITFKNGKAIMSVVRDETTLAGGPDGSIMTGSYEMTVRDGVEAGACLPKILCRMAQSYYGRHNGYFPPVAEYVDNGDGTYTIHLYEIVDDGNGMTHTATSAWYTVDAGGVGKDDIMGDEVNLRN